MKLITRFLYLSAAGMLLLTSCAKEQTESYDKFENQALEAWIAQNRQELLANYQPEGGYYVDVIKAGDMQAAPVNDTACWVKFDLSGRDLNGNIVLTRRAREAYQAGTFTKYTHYIPFYRYCGTTNTSLMEGTYLAMRNTLKLGEDYARERGLDPEFLLREGSQVVLYLPSRIVGTGGVSDDGGYGGQSDYQLAAGRPFVVTMEICDTIKNPLEAEGSSVDAFCRLPANGGLKIFSKSDDADKNDPLPTDPEDEKHPYNIAERWVSACDTIAQLYVNYRYDPKTDRLNFPEPYNVGFEPYNGSDLEQKIADALVERFHGEGDDYKAYEGVVKLDSDSVKMEGTAKIWYIARFLDGFIFDTNIDEVKKIIYGEVQTAGSAKSYTPENGGDLTAFYYTIPHMKFGQWGAFIATSTNAFGVNGRSGSSSTQSNNGYTSSSGYYDYLNYLQYSQMYYGGNGYYGGYYNDYYGGYGGYGGYYGGLYGGYGSGYDSTGTTTTTTTVTTEVPPFTPVIYQFYLEPADE